MFIDELRQNVGSVNMILRLSMIIRVLYWCVYVCVLVSLVTCVCVFQDLVLEVVYPRCGACRVSDGRVSVIKRRMSELQSGEQYSYEVYNGHLLSGSRAEGLAMDDLWGHDKADTDCMYLYGGPIGVNVPGGQQSRGKACLEFRPEGCPAAYTKLLITDLHGLKRHRKIGNWIEESAYRSGNQCWLNTYRAVREMKGPGETISGPAGQWVTFDYVKTLVSNGPHPDMDQEFANRPRQWPPAALISDLLKLPMLLVLVGHKLSPEFHLQARVSWSHLELKLMQELPESVRQGYIACKYVFKRFLKAHRGQNETGEGRTSVSSYFIKTTFLRYLEKTPASMITSPFKLFSDLLRELDEYLKGGKLPHYFLPQCNLLETVADDELRIARQVIEEILSDPLNALLTSPTAPQEIYGEVHPDYLVSAFCKISSHATCKQYQKDLSKLLARVDERRRQRYREQRERDRNWVSGRGELIVLVDALKQITLD